MITDEKTQQLIDTGNDYVLCRALSDTEIGESFGKKQENQDILLDKGLDNSLAAVIAPKDNKEDNDALMQSLFEKGMISSLQIIVIYSGDTDFTKTNPNWEDECTKNSKTKVMTFEKQ